MRGYHDIGGLPEGPVSRSEHEHALWEKRVDALLVLLSQKGMIRVDELRRGIEGLGADVYERTSYYERWIASIANVLIGKGVIGVDELSRRMQDVHLRERPE